MKKIIILNGPPRSGKDFIADFFLSDHIRNLYFNDYSLVKYKFASFLKNKTHNLFCDQIVLHTDHTKNCVNLLSESILQDYKNLFLDEYKYEEKKDQFLDEFYGKTPREIYIALSELFFKPLYGKSFFGERLTELIKNDSKHDLFIISDGGFEEELIPLILEFGIDNILLCHLHRENCNFSKDSRKYIYNNKIKTLKIINTEETFKNKLEAIYINNIISLLEDNNYYKSILNI